MAFLGKHCKYHMNIVIEDMQILTGNINLTSFPLLLKYII